jgi:DNA-binding Lrp family transcriptional regulator
VEQLDDKDVQLLRLLQKNAKLTVKELAKEVNSLLLLFLKG